MQALLTLPVALASLFVTAAVWLVWTVRNEKSEQPATLDGRAPAALPLILALLLLVSSFALMAPLPWASASALVMSGFFCGFGMRNTDVLDSRLNAVFLPIMLVFCTLATYACFATFSFASIFPGLTVAFASGQLAGMLGRGFFIRLSQKRKDAH